MRRLADLANPELRNAALALARESGHTESWRMARDVATRLDASVFDAVSVGVRANHYQEFQAAVTRFTGRVRRQLDNLADEGLIIKVGARERLPDGHSGGQYAHYYTPEAFEAARQQAAERRADTAALEQRWTAIRQRLLTGPGVALNRQRQLTTDEWEQLLDKAGWW
jgi:hypothetical protein